MSGGKLEVQIGADITDFEKKIKEIEFDIKELSKVKLDRIKLGLDTTEINAQIKDAKNNLNQLKSTVKDTGNVIGKDFKQGTVNGGNALLQFSRIAQDAPFGIIGIGNNITATVESFAQLKNASGSTGGALKALATSIAGTGGILLGVSLLTTGLTLLSQSGLSVSDVIDKISGKFDVFGNTLNKIAVDAAKSSSQEIANLNALVSVAQDEVKSRKDRLTAVEELQNKYPGYFGNLTKEQILTGNLTLVTKELSKAIIARAEATAISDKIGELAAKKLDLQIQKEKAILKLQEAQAALKNKVTVTGGTLGATGLSSEGQLASATGRVRDLNKDILEIQIQQDKLAQRLNEKTSESIKLLETKQKIEKVFSTPNPAKIVPLSPILLPSPRFDPATIPIIGTQLNGFVAEVSDATKRMILALADFNTQASQIINGAISNTFASLGSAIGEALATGGSVLESIGVALLGTLGGLLVEMGKMAIQIGVSLLAIKVALKSLNPAVAIAAGVALVALGSFFSSKSRSLSNSIGGGGNTSGGTGAGANNQSFTSSSFASRGSDGGTVIFEIAGQKLVGVLSNTLNANRRLGGQLGLG